MESAAAKIPRIALPLGVIAFLAFLAVLFFTLYGAGISISSLPIIEAARAHRLWRPAPAYSLALSALASAKHDVPTSVPLPHAILLALSTLTAAITVWRSKGDRPLGAILTAVLILVMPTVLYVFTLVRPEPLLIFSALATLAFAEEFGRTRKIVWILPTIIMAAICTFSGIGGGIIIVAAIVAITAAWNGVPPGLGHLWFAIFYAAVIFLITPQPHPAWMFSPALAAVAVFIGAMATVTNRIRFLWTVAVGSLAVTICWTAVADRNSHDFTGPTWRHSPSVQAIAHLPKDSIFYSNAPEVIARFDHHTVRPLPSGDDDPAWAEFLQTLKNQESFILWFNSIGGNLESLNAHIPLEIYKEQSDGVLYRADAIAWTGGRRRIAFNPDTPSIPARRSAGHSDIWNRKHASYVEQAAKGNVDLLFLGDSITDDYRTVPGAWAFFEERYGPCHPANFGIDGDRTQHLLFRILNGECDHLSPKVAVILIGTNNTAEDSAEAIAKGIEACVRATQQKLPTTRILLLGLFPRGGADKKPIILKVNQLLAALDNGDTVRYLNLYDKLLEHDGSLSKDVMYDSLHPSLRGYHMWADAMQPLLDDMMRAPPLNPSATAPTTRSH